MAVTTQYEIRRPEAVGQAGQDRRDLIRGRAGLPSSLAWSQMAPASLPDVTTNDSSALTGDCPELVKRELVGDRPRASRAWITRPVDWGSLCCGCAAEFG